MIGSARRLAPAVAAALVPFLLPAAAADATLHIQVNRSWSATLAGPFPADARFIRPVWNRQNIWKPWKQWTVDSPKAFAPYLREAALVMPTGARPSPASDDHVPDIYLEGPEGKPLPFDPKHPFFGMLLRLRKAGILPLVDIGAVPVAFCRPAPLGKAGFDFNIDAPTDSAAWNKYHGFIRDLFRFLQSPGFFTKTELESWGWQLGREPDNPGAWDPSGARKPHDPRNLAAYLRLYDYTLAGMRSAGLRKNLSPGNLAVPYPGCMGHKESWMGVFAKWLAKGPPSECSFLSGPRLIPGDTVTFGFTAYGGGQLGMDPRELLAATEKVRQAILPYFPRGGFRLTVAEGNLMLAEGGNRGNATMLGAAWNAAIFKYALDAGLDRYQQWGFAAASHISEFDDGTEVMPAAYNVVELFRKMEGGKRLPVVVERHPADADSRLDGVAARGGDGALRILAFQYRAGSDSISPLSTRVRITGLPRNLRYSLITYRVNESRGNYFRSWERLRGSEHLPGDPNDALVLHRLTPAQRKTWELHREEFLDLSRKGREPEAAPEWVRSDIDGNWTRDFRLDANEVRLLELTPAQ